MAKDGFDFSKLFCAFGLCLTVVGMVAVVGSGILAAGFVYFVHWLAKQ